LQTVSRPYFSKSCVWRACRTCGKKREKEEGKRKRGAGWCRIFLLKAGGGRKKTGKGKGPPGRRPCILISSIRSATQRKGGGEYKVRSTASVPPLKLFSGGRDREGKKGETTPFHALFCSPVLRGGGKEGRKTGSGRHPRHYDQYLGTSRVREEGKEGRGRG